MSTVAASQSSTVSRRLTGLDRLRGLAVVLMLVDHLLVVTAHGEVLRLTVTRASMPLFFLVAGSLVRRLHPYRLLIVLACGVLLPLWVPWIDAPNVLVWYVAGAVLLLLLPAARGRWIALAVCAALAANGYGAVPGAYSPGGLWVLMLAGAIVGPAAVGRVGERLPAWLVWAGRWPLSVYVGHLLVLRSMQLAGWL